MTVYPSVCSRISYLYSKQTAIKKSRDTSCVLWKRTVDMETADNILKKIRMRIDKEIQNKINQRCIILRAN